MTPLSRVLLLASVPPACAGILWVSVLAVAAITGQHPIWGLQPRNLSEAAAFEDRAAVVRLAAREDIDREAEVREGVLDTRTTLTPIEAAAATREREMVQIVLDLGASPGALVWQRAFCISDASGVRELLAEHRPQDAHDECAED